MQKIANVISTAAVKQSAKVLGPLVIIIDTKMITDCFRRFLKTITAIKMITALEAFLK